MQSGSAIFPTALTQLSANPVNDMRFSKQSLTRRTNFPNGVRVFGTRATRFPSLFFYKKA